MVRRGRVEPGIPSTPSVTVRRGTQGLPMNPVDASQCLVVRADTALHAQLERLAREQRMVFVAGLPGTGKSLVVQQLAHLASALARSVHLLQWDVARPVFEATDAGQRYPVVNGVTHGLVRKAVGLWARRALVAWSDRHSGPEHLLLGETPFIGNRLIELARREDDGAEPILSGPSCRFVIPVPSLEVRRFLEAERERRAERPVHEREREDAPPHVLRDLWRQLAEVAPLLGAAAAQPAAGEVPYEPMLYRRVYQSLLRHRHVEVIPMAVLLPTHDVSVYDFAVPRHDVMPSPEEAARFIRQVEARYPNLAALEDEIDRWYGV